MSQLTTLQKLEPWVKKLPRGVARITARDGAPDDPPLGEIIMDANGTREVTAQELAELIDGAGACAGRQLSVTLVAYTEEKAVARTVCKSRAEVGVSVDAPPDEPLVKVLTGHIATLVNTVVTSNKSLLESYRQTLEAQNERLRLVEEARARAEDVARTALDIAETTVTAKKDTAGDRLISLIERGLGAKLESESPAAAVSGPSTPDAPPNPPADVPPAVEGAPS